MKAICRFFLLASFFSTSLLGQDSIPNEKIKISEFIDTMFFDRDFGNWSARLFTNYKDNRFQISNKYQNLLYTPSNPFGFGFGVASRKLVVDIAFNIKAKSPNPTERFDLQATFMLNRHLMIFFLQNYQGFNVRNQNDIEDGFREDIRTLSSGINYMYMFKRGKFSTVEMKSGLSKQKRAVVSYGLGGFLFTTDLSADSSIIPAEQAAFFNEEAQIENLFGLGLGIQGGLNVTVPFLKHFFISASATPGIGYMYKEVQSETSFYIPSNPFLFHFYLEGILGYNRKRFYLNISMGLGLHGTDLDYDNSAQFGTTNAKLAFGYKIRRR